MTKAIASALCQEMSTCQIFRLWIEEKGLAYFKGANLESHIYRFREESGLNISLPIAHSLIGRSVHRRNRKVREQKAAARVIFFYLSQRLRTHFC